MSGIKRIKIKSNWSDWRTKLADDHSGIADDIYKKTFNLLDGVETIEVSKDEALARYDWKEGIDVILETVNGTRMTLQEKFLTFWESTITFEETKTSGEKGAWYYCTAQYYFVGYTRKYWDYRNRKLYDNCIIDFQDYILVDLAGLHRDNEENKIRWRKNQNASDGRKSTFKFINFNDVPESRIITRSKQWQNSVT